MTEEQLRELKTGPVGTRGPKGECPPMTDMERYSALFGMNKVDRVMWRMTDLIVLRHVRFALLGVSLVASTFSALAGVRMIMDYGDRTGALIDFTLSFANWGIFLYNCFRYKRSFYDGKTKARTR